MNKNPYDQPETVVFETPGKGAGSSVAQHAITRDPDLADGPYRTLRHYCEYPPKKETVSVEAVARVRGVTPRTIAKHRQALVKLGYLEIAAGKLVIKDPARIERLKRLMNALAPPGKTDAPQKRAKGGSPLTENEAALLEKLKQLHPNFHRRGGVKLLRGYKGSIPITTLLDRWIEARRQGLVPETWGVGLFYREIEEGRLPPAAPPRDQEWEEALNASRQKIQAMLDGDKEPPEDDTLTGAQRCARSLWRAALKLLESALSPAVFSVLNGSTGDDIDVEQSALSIRINHELLPHTYIHSVALQAVNQVLEGDDFRHCRLKHIQAVMSKKASL